MKKIYYQNLNKTLSYIHSTKAQDCQTRTTIDFYCSL